MIYTVTLNPALDYTITMENFNVGELNRIKQYNFFAGGKGVNVSRILNQMGCDNIALGFTGGFSGNLIKEQLKKEKIKYKFIDINENTRINIKINSEKETELNNYGPNIEKESAELLLSEINLIKSLDTVILSGSKPKNLPSDYYENIIKILKKNKIQFVIDLTGNDLLNSLKYKPLLVKPNNFELSELFNVELKSKDDLLKYGKKLITYGSQFAIVSLGSEGALLFTPDSVYQGFSPNGIVKNTVGAGDSMVAGFVGKYLDTKNYLDSFKYALAAGSATAFSDDVASKDSINKLFPEIIVEKINEV